MSQDDRERLRSIASNLEGLVQDGMLHADFAARDVRFLRGLAESTEQVEDKKWQIISLARRLGKITRWRERLWDEVHSVDGPQKARLVELGKELDDALSPEPEDTAPEGWKCDACRDSGVILDVIAETPNGDELGEVPCPDCQPEECELCEGTGLVDPLDDCTVANNEYEECSRCKGRGYLIDSLEFARTGRTQPCPACSKDTAPERPALDDLRPGEPCSTGEFPPLDPEIAKMLVPRKFDSPSPEINLQSLSEDTAPAQPLEEQLADWKRQLIGAWKTVNHAAMSGTPDEEEQAEEWAQDKEVLFEKWLAERAEDHDRIVSRFQGLLGEAVLERNEADRIVSSLQEELEDAGRQLCELANDPVGKQHRRAEQAEQRADSLEKRLGEAVKKYNGLAVTAEYADNEPGERIYREVADYLAALDSEDSPSV